MPANKTYNEEISKKDIQHFLHPWTQFDTLQEQGSMIVKKATGIYVFDAYGNKYLDTIAGLWCNNIGSGRQEVAEAIYNQVCEMAYANPFGNTTNIPAVELASKLADLAPGDINHVLFTTGGSTAVDSAFRLVHYYQNCRGKHHKKHILSRDSAYHGSTYAAMSIGGKKADHPPEFEYIQDTIHHLTAPNYYRSGGDKSEEDFVHFLVDEFEQKVHTIGEDNVAAFFAEPIMGAGGVIVPPKSYHRRIYELCRKYDILYVADEVVTAFGRLGHWFASAGEYGIQPDIITCAKGITSGYIPLGATLYSDTIHNVISEVGHNRCFSHGFTYAGHAVACAAALKNIEIIERESILSHVNEVGPYLQEQLMTLSNHPLIGQVRGCNLMACLEVVANKTTKALHDEKLQVGRLISERAIKHGLIVRPIGHLIVLSPPLIINHQEIDFVVEQLKKCLDETLQELNR